MAESHSKQNESRGDATDAMKLGLERAHATVELVRYAAEAKVFVDRAIAQLPNRGARVPERRATLRQLPATLPGDLDDRDLANALFGAAEDIRQALAKLKVLQ